MSPDAPKPVVALYLRYYLSPSETFVYRQLLGVRPAVHPIVLTSRATHLELFPTEELFVREKGFWGKVGSRLVRTVTGRSTAITPAQSRYWTRVLVERKARLIHAHFGHFALDVLPVARSLGLPLLVTFHGFDASKLLRDRRYTDDLARLFEYAHVLTVSRDMADRLDRYGLKRDRLDVHYIGAPVEDFAFVERTPIAQKITSGRPLTFLQVSNFVEKKGHEYTVEAFARYSRDRPTDRLVLAGDGPLRGAIEGRCGTLGIRDGVVFPGRVAKAEVGKLMREADVFLHHSVTAVDGDMEGLPTVLMEAMATGLVVVATRHSGIPELVEDGVDGFLVDERDVETYASTLRSLAEAGSSIGRRAREKIERRFNMTVQNAELQQIYKRLIDGARA
jgi:colanic acid/amylovoran biosynthesis glycosyltransferase